MNSLHADFQELNRGIDMSASTFVCNRLGRQIAQGVGERGDVFWRCVIAQRADVGADREQNVAALRQTAERLAFGAQPEELAGILRGDRAGADGGRRGERLKQFGRIVETPIDAPDGFVRRKQG